MNLTFPRLPRPKPSVIPAVILLGVILASPNAANADIHSWTGGDGQWNTGENWSNGVPTISGTADINNGSTISIPLAEPGNYQALRVGTASGGTGGLQVDGGILSGITAYLGDAIGATGSATVTSGTWNNTGNLFVGSTGTATLSVDGGTVITTVGYLGANVNSYGSATVTSGTWSNTNALYVGNSGTGTLAVDGGTVTSGTGYLGFIANSYGSATVTSGTWNNTGSLYVGNFGTGTLAVDGGTITNDYGYLGTISNSHGSATVTSGTWNNTNDLYVGNAGTGTLAVDGGLVRVSGTTYTSGYAGSNGTVTLSGDEEGRGVLETSALAKGLDVSDIGIGKVYFDGGVVRALADNGDFFERYAAGDITMESGGAFVDTNGFAVGITAPLGGEGALHKIGLGTLTLGGSNAYTGGTVIENGTLIAAHNQAVGTGSVTIQTGGTFTIQTGVTLANAIILEGGSVNRRLGNGASLAGALDVSTTLGGGTTSAQTLGGTTSSVTTLQASFSASSGAENDGQRLGGVLQLSGVYVINVETGETDQFVLQLAVAGVTTESFLGWLDTETNQWVNAVAGNIGGTANFVGDRAFDAGIDFNLGTYGVDTVNGTVWAVLNHNSDFAVVPEPSTWVIVALGAAGLVLNGRRKRVAV